MPKKVEDVEHRSNHSPAVKLDEAGFQNVQVELQPGSSFRVMGQVGHTSVLLGLVNS